MDDLDIAGNASSITSLDANQRRSLALKSARLGVWAWDAVEHESFWDQRTCEIYGRPYRGGLGASIDEVVALVHPEDRADFQKRYAAAIQQMWPEIATEYRVVWPDGSVHHVATFGLAFYNDQGQITRTVGVAQDVTLQRQQEEEACQSLKLESVGRLAGGIAHDFNNLLTVINGYAELLLKESREGTSIWAKAAQIKRAGEKAAGLTRQLLAFSRKQVMDVQPANLNSLVQDLTPVLRQVLEETVELKFILEPSLGLTLADPKQISQAILSLAMNARDAMPKGGIFTIKTENIKLTGRPAAAGPDLPLGDCVLLTLSDTGAGMDRETQKHIFEPFFTTKASGSGAGLGLATVHGIVSQSGGAIQCTSELGEGTVFRIYLPQTGNPCQAHVSGDAQTILIVDDEPAFRELLREVLEAAGYRVMEAAQGNQALAIQQRQRIDILITDLAMPDMDGIELIRAFVHTDRAAAVVAISGAFDESVLRAARLLGASATLTKPIDMDHLVAEVDRIAGKRAEGQTS
ncbi:MAG TPA: response regulator [Bryobacteraceae bacterium]|nr:response regulator [Bryobacteraceae bacterium]